MSTKRMNEIKDLFTEMVLEFTDEVLDDDRLTQAEKVLLNTELRKLRLEAKEPQVKRKKSKFTQEQLAQMTGTLGSVMLIDVVKLEVDIQRASLSSLDRNIQYLKRLLDNWGDVREFSIYPLPDTELEELYAKTNKILEMNIKVRTICSNVVGY